MSMKLVLGFERIITLSTAKGIVKVGNVKIFKQNSDGTISLEIDFEKSLPLDVLNKIKDDPSILGIQVSQKIIKKKC